MNKLLTSLLALGLVCSGMWCASYMSSQNADCHAGNLMSVMCAETLEHGSIMSGAMLVIVSVVLFSVAVFIFRYYFVDGFAYIAHIRNQRQRSTHVGTEPTLLQILFARGILHPRKP